MSGAEDAKLQEQVESEQSMPSHKEEVAYIFQIFGLNTFQNHFITFILVCRFFIVCS